MVSQLTSLLWLRWLELKYTFRRAEGFWNAVGTVIIFILLAPGSLLLALGAGWLGFHFGQPGSPAPQRVYLFHALLAAHFLIYQLTHLFNPSRHEAFHLKRFQVFPLPLSRLYRLNLIASATDPVFLFFVPAQLAFVAGVAAGSAWNGVQVLGVFVLFGALNLAWGSLITLGIGRFTAIRWRKDLLVLFLPLLALAVYWVPYWWAYSRAEGTGFLSPQVISILKWLPSGWAEIAVEKVVEGQAAPLEAVLLAVVAWIGYVSGLRLALSDLTMKGERTWDDRRVSPTCASRCSRRWAVWRLPGFDEALTALFEKEFRYLLRSSQGRYAFVWPVVFILIMSVFVTRSAHFVELAELVRRHGLLPFVAFFFLFFLPFYVGLFAYDHRGTMLYFLAPVPFKKVLLAKNLAVSALGMVCFLEVLVFYLLAFRAVSLQALLLAIGGLTMGFPLLVGCGNLISCYFPKPLRINSVRGNNPPQIAVLLGMSLVSVAALLMTLSAGLAVWAGWHWGFTFQLAVTALVALLYVSLLGPTVALYERRREVLLERLALQDIKE